MVRAHEHRFSRKVGVARRLQRERNALEIRYTRSRVEPWSARRLERYGVRTYHRDHRRKRVSGKHWKDHLHLHRG